MTGEGEMFRQGSTVVRDKTDFYAEPIVVNEIDHTLIEVLRMAIATQEKAISSLEKTIATLEKQVSNLEKEIKIRSDK